MSDHISPVSKSCFLSIRDLRRIRKTLDLSLLAPSQPLSFTPNLITATPHIFYPQSQLGRLQLILNSSPLAVSETPQFALITQTAPSQSSPLSLYICAFLIILQCVQNTLARVTLRKGKFDRITPILEELHWLPIEKSIAFKRATLSYNIKSKG